MGLEIFYIYFCKILLQFFVIYTYLKNAYNLIVNEIAIEFIGGIFGVYRTTAKTGSNT